METIGATPSTTEIRIRVITGQHLRVLSMPENLFACATLNGYTLSHCFKIFSRLKSIINVYFTFAQKTSSMFGE